MIASAIVLFETLKAGSKARGSMISVGRAKTDVKLKRATDVNERRGEGSCIVLERNEGKRRERCGEKEGSFRSVGR